MTLSQIELSDVSSGEIVSRWFAYINRDWRGDLRGARRSSYTYINIEHNQRLSGIKTINLEDVILWNPFTTWPKWWGHHRVMRTVEKETPKDHVLLGISFGMAMEGLPWPTEWVGAGFVACIGTTVTFSRSIQPLYPRLQQNDGKIALDWKFTRKLQKSERVALLKILPAR